MSALLALLSLPPIVRDHLAWWVGGLIVIVGLGIYGFRDVRRFSLTRVAAVASVAFKESVRRKVLWVTPLAMLAILALSLIIQAVDPADAIRQLNKFSYFASGLTVVLTAVVLSCTNLPRDMESKVIFTVVTKPATRLEIVLGKIAGFSITSASILVLLLLFTLVFVSTASAVYQRSISAELAGGPDLARETVLEHYSSVGLLASRTMVEPVDLQFYAALPALDESSRRSMSGGVNDAIVPFVYDPQEWTPPDVLDAGMVEPGASGVYIAVKAGWQPKTGTAEGVPPPTVTVSFLDQFGFTLIAPQALPNRGNVRLAGPAGDEQVFFTISPDYLDKVIALTAGTPFFIKLDGGGANTLQLPPDAIQLYVPQFAPVTGETFDSHRIRSQNESLAEGQAPVRPLGPIIRGRPGRLGQQLVAAADEGDLFAVFRFQDVTNAELVDGELPFEMRAAVQRSGEAETRADLTHMSVKVRNRSTGEISTPTIVYPETNQPVFFSIPADAVAGGSFELILENQTAGNVVEFGDFSVVAITARQPYLFNLAKGFTALWLLSVLVTTVGVFASTFVSWPIAVVVSACVLVSRWAVDQLGDIMQPGFGQRVAGDIFADGTSAEAAVTQSAAEALNRVTVAFASLLPDLGTFDAATWIEAGQSVPMLMLGNSALVVLVFALPLVVIAYVRLRTKEVAA